MSQRPSSSGSAGNLPVIVPSSTSAKPSSQQEPSKIPKPETAKKTTKPASAMKETAKKTDPNRRTDIPSLKSSVSKVDTKVKEAISASVSTSHKTDLDKKKTVTKVADVTRSPRVVATVPKVVATVPKGVAEVLKSSKKVTKEDETKPSVILKTATEITKTPQSSKLTLVDEGKKDSEKNILKSSCNVKISDPPISPKSPTKVDNTELIKLLNKRDHLKTSEIVETKSGSISPKSPSKIDNTELIKLLNQGINSRSGSSSPRSDISKSPAQETTKEGDAHLIKKSSVVDTPKGTEVSTAPKFHSKETVKTDNELLRKNDESDKETSDVTDVKSPKKDVKIVNILKTAKKEVPKSPRKTATTVEYLKQSLKNVETQSLKCNVETTRIDATISSVKQTTYKSKVFELESIDSPKDASNISEAKKSEGVSPKKVDSPKKKKVDSPIKTGSPKKRSDSESPSKPDSPKVVIINPSGKVVGVIDPEDVTKSPKKKPMVKSEKHKSLFPKDDSGLSGSGSDCESPIVDMKTSTASPYAWYAPVRGQQTLKDDEATGDDLPNFTSLIYGTWNKVYSWPPIQQQLHRPREITFESPSKLESVLYTCRCKPDYMDFYAPVKVIPEDHHNRVFSCQLVNHEDDVTEALQNESCNCRAVPLVKKIVFLPINEHYVLMYSKEEETVYSEANPNTAYLLYRGIPSQKELEYHIGHLNIFQRPGSVAFMAKYQE